MYDAVTSKEINTVSVLALTQNRRRLLADIRIPRPKPAEISSYLAQQSHGDLVWSTQRASAIPRGVAVPVLVEHPNDSDELAYWPRRNGTTAGVYVSGRSEQEHRSTLFCVLQKLDAHWRRFTPDGVSFMWPSRDFEVADIVSKIGLQLDAFFAMRDAISSAPCHARPPDLRIRPALPQDLPSLIRLAEEVVNAHIPYSPFARLPASLGARYRERLTAQWEHRTVDGARPISFVAELDTQVVAMADCRIVEEKSCMGALVHRGKYLYVNSFAVAKYLRGTGVGTALANYLHGNVLKEGCCGSYLWFSAYNPNASRFWRKAGYVPLWTSFQRRGE
ncbi:MULTISPECIES: GNAT family N-acetyltransferase [unclassified Streptomyces]|uniref:GNAT family N-acetyltransferase n=1 Tax=unclassified Streptomyces TaxID=2593676 RepID=UPI00364BDB4D